MGRREEGTLVATVRPEKYLLEKELQQFQFNTSNDTNITIRLSELIYKFCIFFAEAPLDSDYLSKSETNLSKVNDFTQIFLRFDSDLLR